MDSETVYAGGERFELVRMGEGPLVLCAHGFPDTPASFAPLMERLAGAGYRAVAPYLRGYAPSTLRGPFTFEQTGRDLIALADALSPDAKVHVVGHDLGALAAYGAMQRAPERFARAVTMSVPHPLAILANVGPAQLARSWYIGFFQLPALPERAVRDLIPRLWRKWSPGLAADAHVEGALDTIVRSMPAPLEHYRALARPLARSPERLAALRRPIRVPTLYLHGEEDGCIGLRSMRGQARWFEAEHRERVIAGAGHFLQLERPERVAHHVLSWLAEG